MDHVDSIYTRLDSLVAEYIRYRGLKYQDNIAIQDQMTLAEKLSKAMEVGDYQRGIELWDRHTTMSPEITDKKEVSNTRVEILLNLIFVTYPFRLSTLRKLKSPKLASKVASKSMTIFKKFLSGRGKVYFDEDAELRKYRNLAKVAFPPTHPVFKDEWLTAAKTQVLAYFAISSHPALVKLYTLPSELAVDEQLGMTEGGSVSVSSTASISAAQILLTRGEKEKKGASDERETVPQGERDGGSGARNTTANAANEGALSPQDGPSTGGGTGGGGGGRYSAPNL